jgi:hypothetical protein
MKASRLALVGQEDDGILLFAHDGYAKVPPPAQAASLETNHCQVSPAAPKLTVLCCCRLFRTRRGRRASARLSTCTT